MAVKLPASSTGYAPVTKHIFISVSDTHLDYKQQGFATLTTQQPLATKVDTNSPEAAVNQSVYFACGRKGNEFV
jgi:hypothetical protein